MSDKGEKTCPLCAEEMDLTDQQLKPCGCGYEICVWCWNHIMEMAEKDATEGRCPACRTTYDKEKIVATAANCEKVVAEINSDRKQKSQKAKPKVSEGRMHLNNVRVIQRNLVYIIGLPLNLADEDLLQQGDYFGQYGKVLKVSISRTATGAIQHSANNSCCVYITYSKEDEAVRCIQSVHSFVLDGKPLRACFGTTKYCHAWLRNMPCSIADCLYLHDFGPEEDSFTKDEIVSAFTRSRDQQIIGATNNLHRRSGNVLPPPADDYVSSNKTLNAKAIANNSSNNVENCIKGSSVDSITGRSNGLPAAASWVMRVSASLPPNTNFSGPERPPTDLPNASDGPHTPKLEIGSTPRSIHSVESVEARATCEVHLNSKLDPFESAEEYTDDDCQIALTHTHTERKLDPTGSVMYRNDSPCLPSPKDYAGGLAALSSTSRSLENTQYFSGPGCRGDEKLHTEGDVEGLYSGLSSICLQGQLDERQSARVVSNSSVLNDNSVYLPGSQVSQEIMGEQFSQHVIVPPLREASSLEDVQNYVDQRFTGLESIRRQQFTGMSIGPQSNANQSSYHSWQPGKVHCQGNHDAYPGAMPKNKDEVAFPLTSKDLMPKTFSDNETCRFVNLDATFDCSTVFSDVGSGNYLGKHDCCVGPLQNSFGSDMGESSIISKILSIDSDAWEDSLTSPHSLVKLLEENDKQQSSLTFPSLLKESDNRQSRFSFARQENLSTHSLGNTRHTAETSSASNSFVRNKDLFLETKHNIFSPSSSAESDNFPGSHYFMPPSVSKAQAYSPPRLGLPSRAPPPGFSTPWMMQKPADSSANHLPPTSALSFRNGGRNGDVDFVDPAILDVRRQIQATGINNQAPDMRQTSSQQLTHLDHKSELQLLMQHSIPEYQNIGFPSPSMNRFSSPDDSFSVLPTVFDQSQPHNQYTFVQPTTQQFRSMHMSSGHLGTWNEISSRDDFGTSDWMTNGGFGFNKFSPNYQDIKCQMSSSSNIYNNGFAL